MCSAQFRLVSQQLPENCGYDSHPYCLWVIDANGANNSNRHLVLDIWTQSRSRVNYCHSHDVRTHYISGLMSIFLLISAPSWSDGRLFLSWPLFVELASEKIQRQRNRETQAQTAHFIYCNSHLQDDTQFCCLLYKEIKSFNFSFERRTREAELRFGGGVMHKAQKYATITHARQRFLL